MESKEPPAQRQWATQSGTWASIREAARENRHHPTQAEDRLWHALRGRRLDGARFRRQHAIGRFLVDFYCAEAGLVVEVDGPVHDSHVEEDLDRERELQTRGLTVVRFKNQDVLNDLASVLVRITEPLALTRHDAR